MRYEWSNLRVSCQKRRKNTKWPKKNWSSWNAKSTLKETSENAGEEATSWTSPKIENDFFKAFRKLNKFSTNKINFFINRYNLRWAAITERNLKLKIKAVERSMIFFFEIPFINVSSFERVLWCYLFFFLRFLFHEIFIVIRKYTNFIWISDRQSFLGPK